MANIKKLKPKSTINKNSVGEPNYDQFKPVFAFYNLHRDYSLKRKDIRLKGGIIDWIASLSTLTWDQIRKSPKEKLGYELIEHRKFSNPKIESPIKVEKYLCFRISNADNNTRVLGYREDDKLYLLFIDAKGELYRH